MNRYLMTGKETVTMGDLKYTVGPMVLFRLIHKPIQPRNSDYFEQPAELIAQMMCTKARIEVALANFLEAFGPMSMADIKHYVPCAPMLQMSGYSMTPEEAAKMLGAKGGVCLFRGFPLPQKMTRQSILDWLLNCHRVVTDAQVLYDIHVHTLAKSLNRSDPASHELQ